MDAMACLENCHDYILEAETDLDAFELVEEALRNYYQWRTRGGFEPTGGDVYYNLLCDLYRELTGSRDIPRM